MPGSVGLRRNQQLNRLLDCYGETFCAELGIPIDSNTPSALFRLLVFSLLSSARINYRIALKAARALSRAGWRTAASMRDAGREDRVRVLHDAGYARYDESTATMLGKTANLLLTEYGGDLRRLRERADGDLAGLTRLLKEFTGIGDVGADIFLREVQAAWTEVYPFVDKRALAAARRLGLADGSKDLADLAKNGPALACLDAALVRVGLEKAWDDFCA